MKLVSVFLGVDAVPVLFVNYLCMIFMYFILLFIKPARLWVAFLAVPVKILSQWLSCCFS